MGTGDRIIVMTPGGGGWGKFSSQSYLDVDKDRIASDHSPLPHHHMARGSLVDRNAAWEGSS